MRVVIEWRVEEGFGFRFLEEGRSGWELASSNAWIALRIDTKFENDRC